MLGYNLFTTKKNLKSTDSLKPKIQQQKRWKEIGKLKEKNYLIYRT